MNANTKPEASPSDAPAPDTTRRTELYLLLAATLAAVLLIPFTAGEVGEVVRLVRSGSDLVSGEVGVRPSFQLFFRLNPGPRGRLTARAELASFPISIQVPG